MDGNTLRNRNILRNMGRKLSSIDFFKISGAVHCGKYDYSKSIYTLSSKKIIIICPIHGEFEQTAGAHMSGDGCAFCSGKRNTTMTFIEKSTSTHGDRYDYSLVEYINAHTTVSIICKIHGVFKQLPGNHISGHGCPKCRMDELSRKFRMSTEEIILKAKEVHCDLYDYDIKEQPKNNSVKIGIICKKHGIFYQKINSHLMGMGCPKCNLSKGELVVLRYLEKMGIKYDYQKRFSSCKKINTLPFDFYLTDFNACIEFDGDQHFVPFYKHGDQALKMLKKTQENDKIKDSWCINNKIPLLRVDNIIDIPKNINYIIYPQKGNFIIYTP
jgi:hypothetical protein